MMTDRTRVNLSRLGRIMHQVRTTIDPNIPVQVIQSFIAVALNEGSSLQEISDVIGSNKSTASRHMLELGERNRKMEPGYGLIDRKQDPMNLRKNSYTLTTKGKMLIRSFDDIMEG